MCCAHIGGEKPKLVQTICGYGRIILYWLARNNTKRVSSDRGRQKGDGEENSGGKG